MSDYQRFIFKSYEFNANSKTLYLYYSLDGLLEFCESYYFDFEYAPYDTVALERAIQALFFMAGVSYYKTYLPPEIVIEKGELDKQMAAFFSKTYQKGLGEYFFVNQLDPLTPVPFSETASSLDPLSTIPGDGLLVGIGGGKDSLVSVELLRNQAKNLATCSVGHRPQLEPLVARIGLPHYWVERTWDRRLLNHNAQGALNGHVPISAILACVCTVVAILSGRQEVLVSNEQSANEPTLNYRGVDINHQYSKSLEFEQDYQSFLSHTLKGRVGYYSFLRPLSEIYIAELFSQLGFEKYNDVFSSCNRAFTAQSHKLFWCGQCPKCAFTFLAFTPFIAREKLEALWDGKNLLLDPSLERIYRQLLGIEGAKPLECVGEVKESRVAMHLAQTVYPELANFQFELPQNYSYKTLGPSSMPEVLMAILKSRL